MGQIRNLKYKAVYASDAIDKIPYGYVNKTICGIGMTCVALENDIDTVIVVPTVYLIKNKIEQYPNNRCNHKILGVWNETEESDIEKYVESNKIIKIMCTYDSLYRVEYLLERCDLVIDESNELLSKTKLKPVVIDRVFDIAEKYKDRLSFVSATPTPLDYMPPFVADLDQVTINWDNMIEVKPMLCPRTYPCSAFRKEFAIPLYKNRKAVVNGREFTKAIVFINSITDITNIVKNINIDPNDCAIICGESTKNTIKIKEVKLKKLEAFDNLPMFTFITSAGFSGIDLVDNEAMTFVISTVAKDFTMLDMLTDLKQATSRQRDRSNPHYGTYVYIYNQDIFDETTDIFEERIKCNYNSLNDGLIMWEHCKIDKTEKTFHDLKETNPLFNNYLLFKNGNYSINEQRFNADRYFFYEIKKQYSKGFNVKKNIGAKQNNVSNVKKIIEKQDIDFYTLSQYFKNNHVNGKVDWGIYITKTEWIQAIEECYKLTGEIYARYSYTKQVIEKNGNQWEIIKSEIFRIFGLHETHSLKTIKNTLKDYYKIKQIDRVAKATDLKEFYDVKEVKMKGPEREKGYYLMSVKS